MNYPKYDNGINPFQHRWRVDDPEFVRLRKSYWPYIKKHFESQGCNAKELKRHKAFFMEGVFLPGDWGANYLPDPPHALAWTPCESDSEMQEVIDWLILKKEDGNLFTLNLFALTGWDMITPGAPIGFALGNEKRFARIFLGREYTPDTFVKAFNDKIVPKYFDAIKFINMYETSLYRNLMIPHPNIFGTLAENLDFYLSCIRYLEKQGRFELDRGSSDSLKDFSVLISAVFHFVEPGQTAEKPPSAMAELAARLREAFLREDAPEYIRREMAKMGQRTLIEHKREPGSTEQVYLLNNLVDRGTSYGGSGTPRVLRGVAHSFALNAFSKAWIENGLIPQDFTPPAPELVDLGSIFTKQMCKELGYDKGQTVPAWKLTVWYTPDFQFSNSAQARIGCDLYFIISPSGVAGDGTATVLHHPKINEFYLDYFPSNVVYLKERQLRRAILEKTGKHLVRYRDGYCPELDENYDDTAALNVGYTIFHGFEMHFTPVSVEGLPVKKLEGKEVVVPSWQEIINNVD